MYTIEEIYKMYDNKNKEIYNNKVEQYLKLNIELFKDEDPSFINVVKRDVENMKSILTSLSEGNIDEALDLTYGLDTLVREEISEILIGNED